MTQEHPITPSHLLINDWCASKVNASRKIPLHIHVAIQAARWGADMELESCCKLLELSDPNAREFLYAARRPKPQSLKEQAFELVDRIEKAESVWAMSELDIIRRALESLPD